MFSPLQEIINDPKFPENVAWKRRRFQPNETIIREGEPGYSLFFIEYGQLRVTGRVELENHHPVRPGICDLDSGDIFGEICLYGSHLRGASVISITDVGLIELDSERLGVYLDAHPVRGYLFLKELFSTLGDRLNRANHRVESLLAWGLKSHGIEKHL